MLGDESGKRIFVLDGAAQQSYDCSCKITDVFEGQTYLAWDPNCKAHKESPPRAFPDSQEEFDKMIQETMLRNRR